MTIDYTKQDQQKSNPPKAEELQAASHNSTEAPKAHDLEERICKRCYAIGRARTIERGTWLGYFLPMFFEEPTKLYGCRACNYPDSMVAIKSHEGEQAMYWHLKNKSSTPDTKF